MKRERESAAPRRRRRQTALSRAHGGGEGGRVGGWQPPPPCRNIDSRLVFCPFLFLFFVFFLSVEVIFLFRFVLLFSSHPRASSHFYSLHLLLLPPTLPLHLPTAPHEICKDENLLAMSWKRASAGETVYNKCPTNATGQFCCQGFSLFEVFSLMPVRS